MYDSPSSVENNIHAMLSGMWFFKQNVLDDIDLDENAEVDEVTDVINRCTDKGSREVRESKFPKISLLLNGCK